MSSPSPLEIDVLRSPEEILRLRETWNRFVSESSGTIGQIDLTTSYEWIVSLWESHLSGQSPIVVVLKQGREVVGLFPIRSFRRSIRAIPCRSFEPVSELYSGRAGFLLRDLQSDALAAMLSSLRAKLGEWDTFSATVVQGSIHETVLLDAARRENCPTAVLDRVSSPYIEFQENWQAHFAALPKKLRSTMRNGEKRLRERGELSYREFNSPQDIREFNSAVNSIEAESWKSATGTAIASSPIHEAFHSALAWRAAKSGWFSGHILYLDGTPIAYIMGLLHNGIFLDLKESYRSPLREMSPGHVLKNFAFAVLYQKQTRCYDFMGTCEEYKMKWTDKIYTRVTYLLFNTTMRGRLAHLLRRDSQSGSGAVRSEESSAENSTAALAR